MYKILKKKRIIALLMCPLLLAGLVFTKQVGSIFKRLSYDFHAGMLEQTIKLGFYRNTKSMRRALAGSLGLNDNDSGAGVLENRIELPEFLTIPAADISTFTSSVSVDAQVGMGWSHSFGGVNSAKYSAHDQINRDNVKFLTPAWSYEGEGEAKNIHATPIYTGKAVVFPDTADRIVAVDPANGAILWLFDSGHRSPARRGMTYLPGDSKGEGVIYYTADGKVFALDAATGVPVDEFNGGSVSLGYQSRIAPMIAGGRLVTASFKPALHVFDLITGDLLQEVDYLDTQDTRGWLKRFLSANPDYAGANPWGGMAVDIDREIAFLSTSNPTPVGVGINRHGDNEPTVSLIAISISKGDLLWNFQDVRHDLWDLDIASPPVLTSIIREGKRIDVVVVPTKAGNLLLLDRVTGAPVFDFRMRRAPESIVPGEVTSPYQPDPVLPQSFGTAAFTIDSVTNIGDKNRASVLAQIDGASMGFFPPHVPDVPTVFFGLHGGAMHHGASLDPRKGIIYVAASHVPSMFTITTGLALRPIRVQGVGAKPYVRHCSVCHGKLIEGGGNAPALRNVATSYDNSKFRMIIRNGIRAMPSVAEISDEEIESIYAMLTDRAGLASNAGEIDSDVGVGTDDNYMRTSYLRLRDFEGYPGSKPPWGTLTAINLNTGLQTWRVPLGRHDALVDRGLPQTGTENISGPMVTAGGLVFASGTKDKLIRAFDSQTGGELWEAQLPYIGSASPMTYFHEGVQYVVVPATGGGTLALYDDTVEAGRSFIAFSLP